MAPLLSSSAVKGLLCELVDGDDVAALVGGGGVEFPGIGAGDRPVRALGDSIEL